MASTHYKKIEKWYILDKSSYNIYTPKILSLFVSYFGILSIFGLNSQITFKTVGGVTTHHNLYIKTQQATFIDKLL